MAVFRVQRTDPQTQKVLHRKYGDREHIEHVKLSGVAIVNPRHRFQNHSRYIQQDQGNQKHVDGLADAIALFSFLQ